MCLGFFFFNDTATTEIYTLSLHDALPIYFLMSRRGAEAERNVLFKLSRDYDHAEFSPGSSGDTIADWQKLQRLGGAVPGDWKSTRLNSSHANISYAVFCLKKKNTYMTITS